MTANLLTINRRHRILRLFNRQTLTRLGEAAGFATRNCQTWTLDVLRLNLVYAWPHELIMQELLNQVAELQRTD